MADESRQQAERTYEQLERYASFYKQLTGKEISVFEDARFKELSIGYIETQLAIASGSGESRGRSSTLKSLTGATR